MKSKLIFILILFSCVLTAQNKKDPLFEEAEISLNQARSQSADFFFPSDFEKSASHYKNAVELSKDKTSPLRPAVRLSEASSREIKNELESSIDILTGVNEKVDAVNNYFKNVIDERNAALNKMADTYAVSFWYEAEEKFSNAIEDYTDKDYDDASDAMPEIIKFYRSAGMYAGKATELTANWSPIQNANKSLAFLLSPQNFSKAQDSYAAALEKIAEGEDIDEISNDIASARTMFGSSEKTARIFAGEYPECIDARKDAKLAKAETYAVKEWLAAEENLKYAGAEFESEDYGSVRKYVNKAFDNYLTAKSLAVKNQFLFTSRDKLEEAKNQEAGEYSPKTYRSGLEYLHQAEKLIDSDNYRESDVKGVTARCEAAADLALEITQLALPVENDDKTLEELILELKGQSAYKTVPKLLEIKEEYVPVLKESKKKINWPGTNIYDNFSADEVEVLERDNKITLRMLNFNFAWIEYKLNDKSKAVLDKLIPVLEKFNNAAFLVASYTDYVAASKMNTEVSELRAKNIADYLSNRSAFLNGKITYAGYGESNAIADNHSIEGRRKNNRIEIVISAN